MYQKSKSLLKQQGLAASKKLGQNFLTHRHTAERIVDLAGIGKQDIVVEVGVGLGALTVPLAEAAAQVIGLEADSGIIRLHEEQRDLPDNVRLLHRDVLKADFAELAERCGTRLRIVANLPYSISSPLLFKLIEQQHLIDFAVVMLQKEVAQRLTAEPGTKEYGVPTVLLATCATVKTLMRVDPNEFHPRPKVDSTVVRITFLSEGNRFGTIEYKLLKRVVSSGFGQRRKTLLNGLAASGLLNKAAMADCLSEAALPPAVRPEQLTPEDFVRLTRIIAGRL